MRKKDGSRDTESFRYFIARRGLSAAILLAIGFLPAIGEAQVRAGTAQVKKAAPRLAIMPFTWGVRLKRDEHALMFSPFYLETSSFKEYSTLSEFETRSKTKQVKLKIKDYGFPDRIIKEGVRHGKAAGVQVVVLGWIGVIRRPLGRGNIASTYYMNVFLVDVARESLLNHVRWTTHYVAPSAATNDAQSRSPRPLLSRLEFISRSAARKLFWKAPFLYPVSAIFYDGKRIVPAGRVSEFLTKLMREDLSRIRFPRGAEISDVILKVNRTFNQSEPNCWGTRKTTVSYTTNLKVIVKYIGKSGLKSMTFKDQDRGPVLSAQVKRLGSRMSVKINRTRLLFENRDRFLPKEIKSPKPSI